MVKKKITKKKVAKKQPTSKGGPKKTKKKSNLERQGNIIIGVMVGLIIILIIFFVMQASGNKFKYEGIEFKKTKYGELQLYTALIPIRDSSGTIVNTLELDFRNDPRELDYIEVELDEIAFNGGLALLSVEDSAEECEDNGIALLNLGGIFLKESGIAAKLTYLNETRALKEGVPYVTCDNTFKNTVVEIKQGNTSSITQSKMNCYELTYNNCDIMMITERFQLEMLKQALNN